MDTPLPRVMEILSSVGLGPDFSGVPALTLELARIRGRALHDAIEAAHYEYETAIPAEVAPFLDGYQKFMVESGHQALVSELKVESRRWMYCGHIDRVGWLSSLRTLIDWKSGDAFRKWPTMRQLAAYRLAWNEQHPTEPVALVCAVQFRGDATYRVHEFPRDELARAESEFLAACTVWHAKERR